MDTVSRKASAIPELQGVYELVLDDFAAVNTLIPNELSSDVALVSQISEYIVESGGKRLRPLIVLLSARCCGYAGNQHIKLAAVIEFLHTATLLHDDVVDRSDLRRGRATANALWGNAPSVLVGDFLYSRAFQLMVELKSMEVMEILANATNVIAEGEVLQLSNVGNADLSEAEYFEVIRCKTALLFEAAAHTGAVVATQQAPQIKALQDFGLYFGMAYQLVDDWLDYAGTRDVMGKNPGDDLAEGKPTLPLIHTINEGSVEDAAVVRTALAKRSADDLPSVLQAIQRNRALDYTKKCAEGYSARALEQLAELPSNAYRDALETLVHYAVARIQ